jgi:hypothetical protein
VFPKRAKAQDYWTNFWYGQATQYKQVVGILANETLG